jgi:hypothetical protein
MKKFIYITLKSIQIEIINKKITNLLPFSYYSLFMLIIILCFINFNIFLNNIISVGYM